MHFQSTTNDEYKKLKVCPESEFINTDKLYFSVYHK